MPASWSGIPPCSATRIGAEGDDLTFDERDSAPFVPKSVVVDPNFDWQGEYRRRSVPWDHTIVYETHVKGFTKLQSRGRRESARDFYAGLGSKQVVDYLRSLGVTTVELLPVHTFINDSHLLEKGLTNYWGYNSIGFFAPDPRYAADVAELAARIQGDDRALSRRRPRGDPRRRLQPHRGRQRTRPDACPSRASTTRSYYRLLPDQPRYYINDTGTGNTLNLSHPRVIQMVDRQPALLGERDACRRLPLRSRHDPGARARRLHDRERLSEGGRPGSRCWPTSS